MGLLAPVFLFGLLAAAIPFWLHRLQTQSSDRKPFSSAMLLETTEERVHVRRKLKYLTLLSLRVLALVLIALAFAKPIWTRPDGLPGAVADGTHLVVLDTSASMSRAGTFEQALALARAAVESAPRGAVLQLIAAGDTVREVTAPSTDPGAQLAALRGLTPDATRLDFGRAMEAIDRLAAALPAPVTLHFVSDLQDSGAPVRFADLVSSNIATLELHAPVAGDVSNWSVDALRAGPESVSVVVTGVGTGLGDAKVALFVNGLLAGERDISGAGTVTLSFDAPTLEPGDNRLRAEISAGDDLAVDSIRYRVVRNVPPAPIPLLTLDTGGLPVTYLSAALHAEPGGAYRVEPWTIGDFDARTLSRYRWAIVDDLGSVDAGLETALTDFVTGGGNLLAFLGQRSATAVRIPILGGAIAAASVGRNDGSFLSVGQVDDSHPLLAATDGWYAVNVSQSLPILPQPEDEVLVRLDNDAPFIIERRIGQGRVLLVAAGLDNRWNDLPVRPVFVSFVIEAARYLGGTEQLVTEYEAGDTLQLPRSGAASGQVIDPDGNDVLSLADTARAQRIPLRKTGFYEVYTRDAEYLVAANIDGRESRLAPMPAETLQRWAAAMGGSGASPAGRVLEQNVMPLELWHVVILILVLVLIAESMLANRQLAPGSGGGST